MAKFDIIVPIYNAEATLERCLRSLQAQSFGDFRAILVENGSQDASATIGQRFAQEDSRFELHCVNRGCGPSGARNVGLERATGEHVAFVDSDDYVVPDYLACLKTAFDREQADVVFFGYHQYAPNGKDLGARIPQPAESLAELQEQGLFGYTAVKAFRREIIGDHRFPEDMNLLEDEVFACRVLATPRRFCVLPQDIYCYVIGNPGSLVGRTHQDYCRKMEVAYEAWRPILAEEPLRLQAQADTRVRQCMYYGFERDVDAVAFFRELSETTFFRECASEDKFCRYVREGNWCALKGLRRRYLWKTTLAKWIKGSYCFLAAVASCR